MKLENFLGKLNEEITEEGYSNNYYEKYKGKLKPAISDQKRMKKIINGIISYIKESESGNSDDWDDFELDDYIENPTKQEMDFLNKGLWPFFDSESHYDFIDEPKERKDFFKWLKNCKEKLYTHYKL